MSDYNYSKLLALMKVVPAYPAAAVAFRDVETIVHEQHEHLTLAEAVVKEAFEFAAGFGDTVGRVNISGLRKSLQAYDKGKGGE